MLKVSYLMAAQIRLLRWLQKQVPQEQQSVFQKISFTMERITLMIHSTITLTVTVSEVLADQCIAHHIKIVHHLLVRRS